MPKMVTAAYSNNEIRKFDTLNYTLHHYAKYKHLDDLNFQLRSHRYTINKLAKFNSF